MRTRSSAWLIPAGLVVFAIVPALGGAARMANVASGTITPDNARFIEAPFLTVLHISLAILFSVLGAFQFSAGLRQRWPRWHRWAGRVLLPTGLVVALSGLWMTLTFPWAAADNVAVYVARLLAGAGMLASLVQSVRALLRRKYSLHGEWMIRAYAIGMGAGTQVLTHLPWFILVDLHPAGTPRAVMMALGWIINVVVAEWIIRRPVAVRRARLVTA